jgi:hypothetical protein
MAPFCRTARTSASPCNRRITMNVLVFLVFNYPRANFPLSHSQLREDRYFRRVPFRTGAGRASSKSQSQRQPRHLQAPHDLYRRGPYAVWDRKTRMSCRSPSSTESYVRFNGLVQGRFFAATELKAMMAHLVINYDVQAEVDGVQPANKVFNARAAPSATRKLRFRKRQ